MEKVRYNVFRFYWAPLLLLLIAGEIYLFHTEQSIERHAALLGAVLPVFYFIQKQKLDELHVFLSIFEKANERYKALGSKLEIIISKPVDNELDSSEKETLISYFNLCAEEYLYFKQGYIFPHFWASWENGMRMVFLHDRVKSLWELESKTHSYYGLVIKPRT